jgi:murein DD-endopeptidase MepM/ murein hydrolase activator NlpD
MRNSKGQCREISLLTAVICCLFISALLSGLHAHDYAEILIPDHDAWQMWPIGNAGESVLAVEVLPWPEPDGEGIWACPRCGARDNIFPVARCIECGYARSNPEGYLLLPAGNACVTNGYSGGHMAVDFGIPEGSAVFAADDGTVTGILENDPWEGIVLTIGHGDGTETLYGHLLEVLVPLYGYVRMGEVVALSGNSGASTGPHLHFALYRDGDADDPLSSLGPRQKISRCR